MNMARFARSLVGVTLSLSLLLSGSIFLTPKPAQAAALSASTIANNIIKTGKRFLGVPYKWGSPAGRTDEFDCSSFTQYVFKLNGISLPRNSRQQSKTGI